METKSHPSPQMQQDQTQLELPQLSFVTPIASLPLTVFSQSQTLIGRGQGKEHKK